MRVFVVPHPPYAAPVLYMKAANCSWSRWRPCSAQIARVRFRRRRPIVIPSAKERFFPVTALNRRGSTSGVKPSIVLWFSIQLG